MRKTLFLAVAFGLMAFSGTPNAADDHEHTHDKFVKEKPEVLEALEIKENDRVYGNKNAPITIVEYASMTCGHCADFHTKFFPEIKEKLIDTGRVNFVFRELPWENRALAVSVLARCAPKEDHAKFISAFFGTLKTWARSDDFLTSIKQVARLGGMSSDEVDACLKDVDINQVVQKNRVEALEVLEVGGTPAFFINGRRFEGVITAGEMIDYVESLEAEAADE